jgi:DNA-binding transcriptional LysR family regulator
MIWEKLNRFAIISEYKSFSEAQRLGEYSQSTCSRDIAYIEKKLNTQLIYRNYKGIKLTEKGKFLLSIILSFKGKIKNFELSG